MIKVFELNKNKKIELTKKELEEILNKAYWEGYCNHQNTWTYTTPNIFSTNNPYTIVDDTQLTMNSITTKE